MLVCGTPANDGTAQSVFIKLARTNAYTSLDFTGEKNYFAEAFAAINTRGTKVYFGSNWGDFTSGEYSDAYVLTVPNPKCTRDSKSGSPYKTCIETRRDQ